MDAFEEIKQLYYGATKSTIERDVDRAIDLLKAMANDDEREKAAVYMDGLAQMRSEWRQATRGGVNASTNAGASARPGAGPRGRSGPSTGASRRSR